MLLLLKKNSVVYHQEAIINRYTVIINLLVVFGVLFLFANSKAIKKRVLFRTSMFLVFATIIWTCLTATKIGITETLFVSTSPYVYFVTLMFCVGYDEELFNREAEMSENSGCKYSLW